MAPRRRKTPRRLLHPADAHPADAHPGRSETLLEQQELPRAVLAIGDHFPRRLGDVSHIKWEDLGRIEQAAHVLANSGAGIGCTDVGVFWSSYRSWTPMHSSARFAPPGAVLLTLVRLRVGLVVVATFITDRQRRIQWVPLYNDEAHRSPANNADAIAKANKILGVSPSD